MKQQKWALTRIFGSESKVIIVEQLIELIDFRGGVLFETNEPGLEVGRKKKNAKNHAYRIIHHVMVHFIRSCSTNISVMRGIGQMHAG